MSLIDKQGFIHFWRLRINIIDFLVVGSVLCLLPAFYYGHKILSREPEGSPIETHYEVTRSCPICGKSIRISTIKSTPLPEFYETVCERCENKVVLFDTRPIKEPPPRPPDWEKMLFKWLYENREGLLRQ